MHIKFNIYIIFKIENVFQVLSTLLSRKLVGTSRKHGDSPLFFQYEQSNMKYLVFIECLFSLCPTPSLCPLAVLGTVGSEL